MTVNIFFKNLSNFINKEKMGCPAGKLSQILEIIVKEFPVLKNILFDSDDILKEYILIFIDNKIFDRENWKNTYISDNKSIKIFIIVSGG